MNDKKILPNGAEIIAINYGRQIVLADNRPEGEEPEYVTWTWNTEQGLRSTCWGHYFGSDIIEAENDFHERCDRGY